MDQMVLLALYYDSTVLTSLKPSSHFSLLDRSSWVLRKCQFRLPLLIGNLFHPLSFFPHHSKPEMAAHPLWSHGQYRITVSSHYL